MSQLKKINAEIVNDTSPPESDKKEKERASLDPNAGIVESDPIAPHAQPDKDQSEGLYYSNQTKG